MTLPFDDNPAYRFGFGASGLGTLTWDVLDDVADALLTEAWAEAFATMIRRRFTVSASVN